MSTIYTSQQRPKVSTSNSWNTAMNGNHLHTGIWESTLGYNVVVVVISADADSKQGGVCVQFHTATTPTDAGTASSTTYTLDTYTAGTGYVRAFGVQGPYFRLEYKNGAAQTTAAHSIVCTLDTVYVQAAPACAPVEFQDTAYDAFRRLRVSSMHTLLSISHNHSKNNLLVDEKTEDVGTVATHDPNQSHVDMSIPSTSSSAAVIRQSRKYVEYQPGKSLLWMGTAVLNLGGGGGGNGANCATRVGLFDGSNGVFFEHLNGVLSVVKRSKVSGTVVSTAVARADFNTDKLDGKGPSQFSIDASKANIFWIDLQWLGVGRVRYGVVSDGRPVLCHTMNHENVGTSPYMSRATLPVRYEIRAIGGASSVGSMRMICSTVSSEGGYETVGIPGAVGRFYNNKVSVNNTKTNIVAIRLKSTHIRARVAVHGFKLLSTASADFVCALYHWRQPSSDPVTANANWTVHHSDSAVEYSYGTIGSFDDGVTRFHGFMSNQLDVVTGEAGDRSSEMLAGIDGTSDVVAVMCQRASGTASQDIFGSISWSEYSS